ncbi:MAG TPA: sulfite oxidase-like oxidoreductase [Acidimicrobiia bacterium]|nr:sulfite oxidase-like oxidoreductase [Acidimicrobiia bacterium]
MSEPFVTRGFTGRRDATGPKDRIPPGQHLVTDFPVLSAGPTPRLDLAKWQLEITGLVRRPAKWSWKEFTALPADDFVKDISCVTTWTKLDTKWHGISLDTLFANVELDPKARALVAECHGGYTTNLLLEDALNGQAFIAWEYDGKPLPPDHGGPARLVVPHLYFWKSAKWIRAIRVVAEDRPGFWESNGYHIRGDYWKEERYSGD